jgi:fumarate reductase subunit C
MFKKSIGYSKFVRNSVVLTISLIAVVFGGYGYFIHYDSVHDKVLKNKSVEIDIVFEALYTTMKNGGDIKQLDELLQNINSVTPYSNIILHRGIDENTEFTVKEAYNKKSLQAFHHIDHMDFVKPILYENECLRCHSGKKVGSVAAVIQLEQDYTKLDISLSDIIIMLSVLFFVSSLTIFITWFGILKKYFITPIESIIAQMKSII